MTSLIFIHTTERRTVLCVAKGNAAENRLINRHVKPPLSDWEAMSLQLQAKGNLSDLCLHSHRKGLFSPHFGQISAQHRRLSLGCS